MASFDIDAFFDYRARRPPMAFVEDHYEGYDAPRLVVRLEHDRRGTPYLLLHGMEPDTHWEAFARAVREVVEHFDVRLVVSLGAVPMAVPHTRPVMATNHASRPELLLRENTGGAGSRSRPAPCRCSSCGWGSGAHDAMGFVAHVPHYVAQFDYPAAALKLLEWVEVVTGLEWDLDGAAAAAERARRRDRRADRGVQRGAASRRRPRAAVRRAGRPAADERANGLPLAEERELPTAEELGAEFERFLAGLDPDDE